MQQDVKYDFTADVTRTDDKSVYKWVDCSF